MFNPSNNPRNTYLKRTSNSGRVWEIREVALAKTVMGNGIDILEGGVVKFPPATSSLGSHSSKGLAPGDIQSNSIFNSEPSRKPKRGTLHDSKLAPKYTFI